MDERDQTFLRGFEAAKAGYPCPDNAYADHAAGHVAFREMTQGVESYLTRRAAALGLGVTQEDVEVAESRATAKPGGQKDRPARNAGDALAVILAGGVAYIPQPGIRRVTVIDLKTLTKFEKAGYRLLWDDADGRGMRMTKGRSNVYLYAGLLMLKEA